MDEDILAMGMQQRPRPQPEQQLFPVGSGQDRVERVALARHLDAMSAAKQVQVVIAEDGHGGRAEAFDEAQAGEGIGAPVHQVAGEPERVASGVERGPFDEALQRLEAPLQVADSVGGQVYFAAAAM